MSRHDKFKAYWESIGKPQMEYLANGEWTAVTFKPGWHSLDDYRIAGDRHWLLRRKWVDSDFTLPIETPSAEPGFWLLLNKGRDMEFRQDCEYREAKAEGINEHQPEPVKHSHYFKDVSSLNEIDVYRVLELFDVTNPSIAHAAKKLLCAGKRGAKDLEHDIQDAIDTLTRWQEMRREDAKA